jgi:hypothetical protein
LLSSGGPRKSWSQAAASGIGAAVARLSAGGGARTSASKLVGVNAADSAAAVYLSEQPATLSSAPAGDIEAGEPETTPPKPQARRGRRLQGSRSAPSGQRSWRNSRARAGQGRATHAAHAQCGAGAAHHAFADYK